MGHHFHLFGKTVWSDVALGFAPDEPEGEPELYLREVHRAPEPSGESQLLYRSPFETETGEAVLEIARTEAWDHLRFPGVGDFFLGPREIQVLQADGATPDLVEIRLLGVVFAYWLERQGLPVLHAAAVAAPRGALAFLGSNRGGKTCLAAAFVRAGWPLVSDDLLPVGDGVRFALAGTVVALPGLPQLRVWPDLAAVLHPDWTNLRRAHPGLEKRRILVGAGHGFGTFHGEALPLDRLFLPERRDGGEIEFEVIPPREALLELLKHSFLPRQVAAAGWEAARLERLARLAERIPLVRLCYPSGFERLDEVRDRLLAMPGLGGERSIGFSSPPGNS